MLKIKVPQQYFESLVGKLDQNLKSLEKVFQVRVSARGDEIFIEGEETRAAAAEQLIGRLIDLLENGYAVSMAISGPRQD